MTHRERFRKLFAFGEVDRIPCYFFGSWAETKARWAREGFNEIAPGVTDWNADAGPQLPGMDPDWEQGIWDVHGLARLGPIGDIAPCVLWEDKTRRLLRSSIGEEYEERKDGTSIAHTHKHALEPTRESWARFKCFLDRDGNSTPGSSGRLLPQEVGIGGEAQTSRYPDDLESKAAAAAQPDRPLAFMGGSLYSWLRGWMGVENISYIMYDDPLLLEEMVSHLTDHFMRLMAPVLKLVEFDFVYFFEDCCGSSGPLFSPSIYKKIFDAHYRRLIRFYKERGVPLALVDSDGWSEALIPCWRDSGFDIFFPIEVGKWGANPAGLRAKYGKIMMFGAVDKRLINEPEDALRRHLEGLRPSVEEGGYLPIPDHRIPPDVSYGQMLRYIEIFHEVFNG